jgi:signal transduction histidine kinase
MHDFAMAAPDGTREDLFPRHRLIVNPAIAAVIIGVAYYVGARLGFALTFQPHPVSTLWPPNSILFAALLLAPTRWWWFLLLAVFPAHLFVEVNAGVPLSMILCWFVSNCSEALIGATFVRFMIHEHPRLDSTYQVGVFIVAALVGPFLSSFLDSFFVMLNRFGDSGYWDVFRMRFFSNVLAAVTVAPLILTWATGGFRSRSTPLSRYIEAAILGIALLLVSIISFDAQRAGQSNVPVLLYLPLPLLLWAAIRFGPRGASTSLVAVSLFAIWGAIHGFGPFATRSPEINALQVQLFLIFASMPLLFLAAVIKERERAEALAHQNEEKLRRSHRQISALAGKLITVQETERRRIARQLHDDLNQKIATLSLMIAKFKKKLPASTAYLPSELAQIEDQINDLTTDVRRISHRLHPVVLEHLGLVAGLEAYVNEFRIEEGIEVGVKAFVGDDKIPLELSVCLYRVAVEALRNVARHSGARRAGILLRKENGWIELQVSDSGQGFDAEATAKGEGLGLVSMDERVKLLRGTFEVQSRPGVGTTISARVPLAVSYESK